MHYFLDLFRVGLNIVCMKYKTDISLGHWLYMELSGLVLDCGADWHSAWRAECPWNSRCFRILNFSLRNKNFTQVVLISLVFLIDVSFGELATCNPQNRECSCADTSSRVSVSFSYKSLKGGLSQFGDRLWSVISFLFLYIYPFNSIRSPNLGPAYLSISKDGGGGHCASPKYLGVGFQFFLGNDFLWNDLPYSKRFLNIGCPKTSKIMFDFWNFCWLRGVWPSLKIWYFWH